MQDEFRVRISIRNWDENIVDKIMVLLSEKIKTHKVLFYSNFMGLDGKLSEEGLTYDYEASFDYDVYITCESYWNEKPKNDRIIKAIENNKPIRVIKYETRI